MDEYGLSTYGEHIADVYDEWYPLPDATDATVEFLARHAATGRVLELAIGTGRVALPLAAKGLEVHGIDASESMVARLRAKPGGADISVTIGDFADVDVEGTFSLVYVVFNTFWALLTQDDQVRCFANVARHLSDDGVFVIEAAVPDPARFDRGQRASSTDVELDHVVLEASRHDATNQRVDSHHVVLSEKGIKLYPVRVRYVWPSELDLMARLAGLRLRERWGGWAKEPYEAGLRHVSVFERAPG